MSARSAFFTEDTKEAQLFLRARLNLFLKLIVLLSGGFFLSGVLVTAIGYPQYLRENLTHPGTVSHLVGTTLAFVVWMLVRSDRFGTRALDILDIAGTFIVCGVFAFMTLGKHDGHQQEHIVLLAISWTLVVRAALVPSPTWRTAIVGLVSTVPLVGMTYATATEAPFMRALYVVFWQTVAIVATSIISKVIYGLRRQVIEAMRVGQYTLVEKIGAGGMGVVYRATHALLRRPTAIKLLPPEKAGASALARFEREVQLTSQLTHPNTVSIYDYGRTPEGVFYYAMEFLDGFTLEDLVNVDGAQPAGRVVHIALQCCGALREAHEAGLVHRDIKPANILLTRRGGVADVAKVVDFGLVKVVMADVPPGGTEQGAIAGTPHYLSPEAITDPAAVEARSDIYSLGATLYYLVTGKTVFEAGSFVELCSKHLFEEPLAPAEFADMPQLLDEIILQCLAKQASDRPSAAVLAEKLSDPKLASWTSADAEAWWSRRAEAVALAARERGNKAKVDMPASIAIDVGSRSVSSERSNVESRSGIAPVASNAP